MNDRQEFEQCRDMVEARLREFFTGPGLEEAMRYSLMAGGKRIRPVLLMKFCQASGGTLEQALDTACGVEMLHTYSLIHDDLPCMDNDDLRRGKPTCHKSFGECTATLAGDALQAAAFETVLASPHIEAHVRAKMALLLAKAVGAEGMCRGQYLDMDAEGHQPTLEELTAIHGGKTAALLKAACQMGVLASGVQQETDALLKAAGRYAEHLGLAFQIRDDLLDIISTTETLGKPVGSDDANGKHTFVTLLGQEACVRMVEEQTALAKQALDRVPLESGFLCWLADELAGRIN
jgi:geranylgeranyl pyrophosphate synthase